MYIWVSQQSQLSFIITKNTYCRETAVHHLQVDSPQLHYTSSLGKYIVHLYSDTDDFHKLGQQTQSYM